MVHKTFISYKFSEAQKLRDRIITALGDAAIYYKGETSDSPDLTDYQTETIKSHLKDMIFDTTVTIVIISPNMKQSKWIDWEIEYSLKKISRDDRTSLRNGIVAVIQKVDSRYDWFKQISTSNDGCSVIRYKNELVYDIINNNRYNQSPKVYACTQCQCVDALYGSYISYVEEDEFLQNPLKHIEYAYEKCKNDASGYKITPTR